MSQSEISYIYNCREVSITAAHKLMRHPGIGTINIADLFPITDEIAHIFKRYLPTLPSGLSRDLSAWIGEYGYKPPVRIPAAKNSAKLQCQLTYKNRLPYNNSNLDISGVFC
jgi:hypothetical protein